MSSLYESRSLFLLEELERAADQCFCRLAFFAIWGVGGGESPGIAQEQMIVFIQQSKDLRVPMFAGSAKAKQTDELLFILPAAYFDMHF